MNTADNSLRLDVFGRSPLTPSRNREVAVSKRGEGGYALLAILLGAVIVSVLLVQALPREAMSAQRIREQRLIDHGEEYTRAIKLYFRENKKYPQELDDLEDTNGVRYLRRRYKDPITGQDEWRIIHVGADGRFKDSLIYDTEDPADAQSADGRMGAGGSGFGAGSQMAGNRNNQQNQQNQRMDANTYQSLYGTPPPAQPGVFQGADLARQTRESAAPVNPLAQQHMQFSMEAGQPQDPNNPETAGLGPDGRPLPAEQQQASDFSNLPPGQVPQEAGQRAQGPQQVPPNYPVQPTGGAGYSLPGSRGSLSSRNQRGGGFNQPPAQMPAPQSGAFGAAPGVSGDAASMIGRLLTTPRPGGLAGIQGNAAMQQAAGQGQPFQEGIAGVASKAEQFGVKVYKGKNLYNEWEFVYDYRQDVGMGGMPATPGSMGNINPNQPGLSAGGGLSGAPATFQPIPGLGGGAPPSGSPPDGSDPRESQFGGMSPPAQLPSTGPTLPDTMPQETPVQEDGATTPQPAEGQPPFPGPGLTPPITQPETTRPPNRTYQLPRSRRGAAPNQ